MSFKLSDFHNVLLQLKEEFGNCEPEDPFCNVAEKLKESLIEETENTPKHNEHDEKEKDLLDSLIDFFIKATTRGFVIGALKNARQYVVEMGGRASNIAQIFDKTSISSLGNPRWYARVDAPHTNVPFHHFNFNPKITGFPDPHIPITQGTAYVVGQVCRFLKFINILAPILGAIAVCVHIYNLVTSIMEDIKNESYRNTITKVFQMVVTCLAGYGGAVIGASIGTMIFPAIGTIIGGLLGGVVGGAIGGASGAALSEYLLDAIQLDIDFPDCEKCGQKFECRRYKEGRQGKCGKCRNEKTD